MCYNYDGQFGVAFNPDLDTPMMASASLLWRVNNEYQKRLKQAQTYLGLLEQLLLMQSADSQTLDDLHQALEQVEWLLAEHRTWRYQYYYESLDTRRMVQTSEAVYRALAQFNRMRARHETSLQALDSLVVHLQPPDPNLTRLPTGDLWQLTRFALQDLHTFDDYLHTLTQV
ncbi:MAG: hypothetical protein CL610_27240 [Anaerolineaceae bacterium]|nr:hypothetical protein [Anaerolineaceae bacterium]